METTVKRIEPSLTKEWFLKRHYARRLPNTIQFAFGLYQNENLLGVCAFSVPSAKMNRGRSVFHEIEVQTYELSRLIVEEDLPKNTLSFFVSQCLKQLPRPSCVVSFADPYNGHHGYIYQACNFLFTGESEKGGKMMNYIRGDRKYHGLSITEERLRKEIPEYNPSKGMVQNWLDSGGTIERFPPKYRYVYLLGSKVEVKRMKKLMKHQPLPYPKGENTRYDSSWVIEEQMTLI